MEVRRRETRLEELLRDRERDGVRLLTLVRGVFFVVAAAIAWLIGASLLEKLATTAIALFATVAIGVSLVLLARRTAVEAIGLIGCIVDCLVLSALPVIWYLSVGGSIILPSYMLKTEITAVTIMIVAVNALAFRPLYPLIVAGAGLCIQAILLVYIFSDPRTIISTDFIESTMGPGLSLELVLSRMTLIAMTGAVMGYLTLVARRMVTNGAQLEITNTQLGRYFSPSVVANISANAQESLGLGGRAQEVAVMFCDIRNFTTMTENLPPSDVVNFLSQYHARMVAEIFAFDGTVDKFIGDAIMVTFGTPHPNEDDVERAVRAGLSMNAALAKLNAERVSQGLAEIRHGIGIHVGPVIAGNIGTEDRLEYTVIGDTVNVASRIQDACKSLGETLLISDSIRQRLGPSFHVRPLPEQHVKGRQAAVRLYAVEEHTNTRP